VTHRDDEGRATTSPTDVQEVDNHTNAPQGTAIAVQLRRRRASSYRLPPFGECSCRDPWTCRHYDAPPGSLARTTDGYCAAAQHLIDLGLVPAPDLGAMRLMWRRDAEQRRLARYIASRWEVAAA
jgi:hypothetical protein